MIKILLVGCNGKMGHMISKVAATSSTLKIQAGVDMNTESTFDYSIYDSICKVTEDVDVILDFSRPSSLDSISEYALTHSLPVVFCTTGYTKEQIERIKNLQNTLPVFFSANMSIGINIINNLLKSKQEISR